MCITSLIKIDVSFVKVNVYDRLKIETPNQSKEICQNQWQQQGKKSIKTNPRKWLIIHLVSINKGDFQELSVARGSVVKYSLRTEHLLEGLEE